MNKKSAIVFIALLLLAIVLPLIVMSQPPEDQKMVKDREFAQIATLLDLGRNANAQLIQNGISPHIVELLTYLDDDNPRQFIADIKLKADIINRLLSRYTIPDRIGLPGSIMNHDVQGAISHITYYHYNIIPPNPPPKSIVMKGEKIYLFQKAQSEFSHLDSNVSIVKELLKNQILPKLEKINAVNPNADLTTAIEYIQNAITSAQEIRDEINNKLHPFMNAYLKTLGSIPEQQITSGLEGDLNGDGEVNIFDLVLVAKNFGKKL